MGDFTHVHLKVNFLVVITHNYVRQLKVTNQGFVAFLGFIYHFHFLWLFNVVHLFWLVNHLFVNLLRFLRFQLIFTNLGFTQLLVRFKYHVP